MSHDCEPASKHPLPSGPVNRSVLQTAVGPQLGAMPGGGHFPVGYPASASGLGEASLVPRAGATLVSPLDSPWWGGTDGP